MYEEFVIFLKFLINLDNIGGAPAQGGRVIEIKNCSIQQKNIIRAILLCHNFAL
jgi:hypothetical protein